MKEKPQSEKKSQNDPGIMYEFLSMHPGQYCGNCTMIIHGPDRVRCTDVVGPINRSGWCKIHKEKKGGSQ